jgi:3-keto-5-aminohexanoate cleavage enzyme
MLEDNKVTVTVAINGGMQQDRDGAIVPKQPVEIGEAAAHCYEAGASVIHFHARDGEGRNSGATEIYAEAIRQIRARSPILIQTTNGIGVRRDPATGQFIWPTDSERLGLLEIKLNRICSELPAARPTSTILKAATPRRLLTSIHPNC